MTDRAVPAPPRLWWVYLLVLFALAALGAGTGLALVVRQDVAQFAAVDECANRAGVSTAGTWSLSAGSVIVDPCSQTVGGEVARTMATGAALAPALSVALAVVGGIAVRLRLPRRASRSPALLAAAARFDYWCAELGLAGRRRPRVRFIPAHIRPRPAFTTAVPFARADIVLPESYAYADQRDFDVTVLHELGHVKAADVGWAAAVWWSGWLPVPALLAVIVPAVATRDGFSAWSISIVTSVVLSVAILVLRAALLRRREFDADRFAADVAADPSALADFFGDRALDPPAERGRLADGVRRLRSVLAVHPSTRARAAGRDDPAWEGGGGVTAIAGLVAMIGWQTAAMALIYWRAVARPHPDVPFEVSLGLAGALWAIVVVPGWWRRARLAVRDGRAVRWRGPFAGAVVGLLAGYCLPVPGMPWLISTWPLGWLPLVLAVFAVLTSAVAVFTASLVGAVANTTGIRAALSRLIVVVAAAGSLNLVWQTTSDLLHAGVAGYPAAVIRLMVNGGAVVAPTVWLVPLVLGMVLVTGFVGADVRPTWPTIAYLGIGVLAGSAFAVLSWLIRWHPPLPVDSAFLITWQKYWICALAGLTVCAAQLIARGGRQDQLPVAIGMGSLTAMAATMIAAAAVAIAGRRQDALWQQLDTTLWLLFVAVMATLPWLPALTRALKRPRPSRLDRRHATRYVAVAVGVAALSLVLLGGLLSPVTVGPHDATTDQAFLTRVQSTTSPALATVPTPRPSTGVDPGRALDPAQAAAVVAQAASALPTGSVPTTNTDDNPSITPPRCASAVALADGIDHRPQTARVERTYSIPGSPGILVPRVIIDVVSLRAAESLDSVIQDVVTSCPTFQQAVADVDGGHMTGQTTGTAIGDQVYAQQVVADGTVHGVVISAVSDWVGAQIGHNYVSIAGAYQFARELPPDQAEQYVESAVSAAFANARAALAH